MPLVGFLNAALSKGIPKFVAAFHQGLKEAGFVEGQNVGIEYRCADGDADRLPALAADLVRCRVVIVSNFPGVLPAKAATATIPIVFLTPGDPVTVGVCHQPELARAGTSPASRILRARNRWEMAASA